MIRYPVLYHPQGGEDANLEWPTGFDPPSGWEWIEISDPIRGFYLLDGYEWR